MKKPSPPKSYKRYIPTLVKEKLDTIQYKRMEHLYCIIDLIYRKQVFFKSDAQKEYGYCGISKDTFNELLGKHENVVKDITFLLDIGLIERNEYFHPEHGICKSYRLKEEYLSKNVGVQIINPRINIRIKNEIAKMRTRKEKRLEFQQGKYFKSFRIDYEAAISFLENQAISEIKSLVTTLNQDISDDEVVNLFHCKGDYKKIKEKILDAGGKGLYDIFHRYILYSTQVNCINDGYLFFKRNTTNNRLDTNLTSLPTSLRPFIISDNDLFNVDIKNSQPYFLYTLLINEPSVDPEELDHYKNLVISGDTEIGIYEYLSEEYSNKFYRSKSRKQMKEILFQIFYSKNTSYRKHKNFFREHFPTINAWIEDQKIKEHSTFAIMLQSMESNVVLDVIMPLLLEKGIIPYTIHDSFICADFETSTLVDVIASVTRDKFGCPPNLHVDCISKVKEDELLYDGTFLLGFENREKLIAGQEIPLPTSH